MLDLMFTNASELISDIQGWKQPRLQLSRFGGVHGPEGYGKSEEYSQDSKF